MARLAALEVLLEGDSTRLVQAIERGMGSMEKLEKRSSSMSGSVKKAFEFAGGIALAGGIEGAAQKLLGFADGAINAAKESKAAGSQLDAVLKSTGGAAGVTADELKNMASAMEKVSLFEDEAIIRGQSLLLTFTNIGKDVFPQATQTILDMSQALGQDMKSSAIQVGKALNDPVQGLTALSRAGVSFTEDQKELIEELMNGGKVAQAQAVILAELEKEFGGSAKAASDAAGATEKHRDRMNELNEVIGEKLLPIQEKWKEAQVVALDFMISKVIPTLEALYAQHWPAIEKVLNEKVIPAVEALTPVFKFMAENAITKIEGMVMVVESVVSIVTRVVNGVKAIIEGDWKTAWGEFKGIPGDIVGGMEGLFKTAFANLPGIFWRAGRDAAQSLIEGIWDGLKSAPGKVLDILGLGGGGDEMVKQFLAQRTAQTGMAPWANQPIFGRAGGGDVRAGQAYWVGDRADKRPELFVPKTDGMIMPEGAGGGPTVVNVYLDSNLIATAMQRSQGRGLSLAARGV
jgi:hypothetical protein